MAATAPDRLLGPTTITFRGEQYIATALQRHLRLICEIAHNEGRISRNAADLLHTPVVQLLRGNYKQWYSSDFKYERIISSP
jgi:hypothetical protein